MEKDIISLEVDNVTAFSGTYLPPIVRLGGSADYIYVIREGTSNARVLPEYIPITYRRLPTVTIPITEVPILNKTLERIGSVKNSTRKTKRK